MKRAIQSVTTLLALAGFMLMSAYAYAAATPNQSQSYDVVIAGAGTGGVSAAIQAARLGARVLLLEETDWIGGQMGAAAVGNMDEGKGPKSTPPSGIYAEFLNRMSAFYNARGKTFNTCYYENNSNCFDPSAIHQVLNEMIADVNSGKINKTSGHIDLSLMDRVVRVLSNGDTITGVVTAQQKTYQSKILIDATEYGDVLPLTPARYRMGHSIGEDNGKSCTQYITWSAVIRKYPQGVPSELVAQNPPPEYDRYSKRMRTALRIDGNSTGKTAPMNFALHNAYRGFPDLANPGNYSGTEGSRITRTGLNLLNDFPVNTDIFDREKRRKIICEAKLKTLANIYYIQTELGEKQWAIANDEGYDSAYNQANSCPDVPQEYKTIERNFPPAPYVRESIRLVGEYTLTAGDIKREHSWDKSARGFADAIAVGNYADDLHGCKTPGDLESDLESLSDLPEGFIMGPFQVPLRSLIPEKVDGLLAAEKNISQSRIANGATRLQPITMLTGEAAGTLAGLAVAEHLQPRAVAVDDVQATLLQFGSILVRERMPDMTIGSKPWQITQFAAVHGWLPVDDVGSISPDKHVSRQEVAGILEGIYGAKWAAVCNNSAGASCGGDSTTLGGFLHAVAELSGQDERVLRTGTTGKDDKPLTRMDAATILYNSALIRIWQRKNPTSR
jgi:hypothetical protein